MIATFADVVACLTESADAVLALVAVVHDVVGNKSQVAALAYHGLKHFQFVKRQPLICRITLSIRRA